MRHQYKKWREDLEPWLFLCADDVVAHIVKVTGFNPSTIWRLLAQGYLYADETTGLQYALDTTVRCRVIGELRFRYRRRDPLEQLEPLRQLCYCVDQGMRYERGELEKIIEDFEI